MKTIVTSYEPNGREYLDDFYRLATLFYPWSICTDVAPQGEDKSSQLLRILDQHQEDDYLILLEEDFYFCKSPDEELLSSIVAYCRHHQVDRFSLQSKNCYQVRPGEEWKQVEPHLDSLNVYSIPDLVVTFSLEASIWKADFLRKHLQKGETEWEIEVKASDRIRYTKHKTYALASPVLDYVDAMRRGKRVMRLKENPLRLTVKPGDTSAIYPDGRRHQEKDENIRCL